MTFLTGHIMSCKNMLALILHLYNYLSILLYIIIYEIKDVENNWIKTENLNDCRYASHVPCLCTAGVRGFAVLGAGSSIGSLSGLLICARSSAVLSPEPSLWNLLTALLCCLSHHCTPYRVWKDPNVNLALKLVVVNCLV